MKKVKKFTILFTLLSLVVLFGACKKEEQLPEEPGKTTMVPEQTEMPSNVVIVKTHMNENVTVKVTLPDYKDFKLTKVSDEGFNQYVSDVLDNYYNSLPEAGDEKHELNEEFAVAMGYSSVDEYLIAAREELNQTRYKQFLSDYISQSSNVDQLPAEELAIRTAQYADEQYANAKFLAQSTGMEIEDVMKKLTGYSEYSDLVGATNKSMKEMLNYQYTMEAIFQKEKLSYDEEELKQVEKGYVEDGYESIEAVEADKDLMTLLILNLKIKAAENYLIENGLK